MAAANSCGGNLMKMILTFLVASIVLCNGRSLNGENYSGMNRLLQSLNKPAVKSILTEIGDIFDCVDIYKQPAFDHPLLKNHTIEFRPKINKNEEASTNETVEIGLPNGGCPDGSVPIRRVKMEDLLRADSLSNFGKKYAFNGSNSGKNHHYAYLFTQNEAYLGSFAVMAIWEPNTHDIKQYSASHLKLVNGAFGLPQNLNALEAGLMVNEGLFGDFHSRLYTHWTIDGYGKTGCINVLCPGFVQLSQNLPLGHVFSRYSSYKGWESVLSFRIRMERSGNWWLNVDGEDVGYWPAALFNSMEIAEKVSWGGEVYNPTEALKDYPEMGSGHWPKQGRFRASYMRNVQVQDMTGNYLDAPEDSATLTTAPKCYKVVNRGNKGDWHKHFYYGGPGGFRC